MIPCSFEESNGYLSAPKNMPECEALSVYKGDDSDGIPFVISCFKLTKEEMIEIARPDATYCNKFYFSQSNSIVKIVCCETMDATTTARFAMAMSIMEFQAFVAAINEKMADINRQIESFKNQTKQ